MHDRGDSCDAMRVSWCCSWWAGGVSERDDEDHQAHTCSRPCSEGAKQLLLLLVEPVHIHPDTVSMRHTYILWSRVGNMHIIYKQAWPLNHLVSQCLRRRLLQGAGARAVGNDAGWAAQDRHVVAKRNF